MFRRDFLGSVIGTIAVASAPSLIAQSVTKIDEVTLYSRIVRMRKLPYHKLLNFRSVLKTPEGRLHFTKTKLCEHLPDGGRAFIMHGVEASQPYTALGNILVDDEGFILGDHTFNFQQPVETCDTLNLTHSLMFDEISLLNGSKVIDKSMLAERIDLPKPILYI